MLTKPVEVWIALDDDGNYIDVDLNQLTTRKRYHAERRLLVKEGGTFADGVEAVVAYLQKGNWFWKNGSVYKEIRALSPAPENTPSQSPMRRENAASNGLLRGSEDGVPSEADKLLRELEAELDAMSWAQNAARDKDLARRVQDYLKERG